MPPPPADEPALAKITMQQQRVARLPE